MKSFTAILTLAILVHAASSTEVYGPHQEVKEGVTMRELLNLTENSNADIFGHTFATFVKFFQLYGFLMIVYDIYSRYKCGKPLYYMHTLRYAIFVYGACCPWLLGGNNNYAPNGYRGWGDRTFYHFFDLIYHGYFGYGYLGCFNHRITVDGKPYGFNYINILTIEILLFMLGKAAIWSSWDGFYRRNKWVHFISTLKGMYLEFFGFPYAGWAVFWFKQHFELLELEAQGKVVDGRNDVVYWFSWGLALWMTFEVLRSIYEIYEGNRDQFDEGLFAEDPRGKPRDQVPEFQKLGNESHRNPENQTLLGTARLDGPGQQAHAAPHKKEEEVEPKPNSPGLPCDPDAHPDVCTYIQCYIEYWFCYQHHFRSVHNKLSQYYFTLWVCRWVIFAVFAIVWYKYPRTLYILFLILNLLTIALTVASRKSFRMYYYWWILAEEILVTIWHLAALILYIDYYGKRTMRQSAVDAMSHLMFWPYVITVSMEFIMMWVPLLYNEEYFSHFQVDTRKYATPKSAKKIASPHDDIEERLGVSNPESSHKKPPHGSQRNSQVFANKDQVPHLNDQANNSLNLN